VLLRGKASFECLLNAADHEIFTKISEHCVEAYNQMKEDGWIEKESI
jgi:hypothetical protein